MHFRFTMRSSVFAVLAALLTTGGFAQNTPAAGGAPAAAGQVLPAAPRLPM